MRNSERKGKSTEHFSAALSPQPMSGCTYVSWSKWLLNISNVRFIWNMGHFLEHFWNWLAKVHPPPLFEIASSPCEQGTSLIPTALKIVSHLDFSRSTLYVEIQGGFFNWASPEKLSRLAPPIYPSTGPPLNLLSMRITKHLDFFRSLGGASLGL